MAVKYTELGTTGWKVSRACLGTMTWGSQNSEAEGHAQLDYALERGINFIDTAEMYSSPPRAETYGATETIIGTWLKDRGDRDKIYLASKIAGPGTMTWMSSDGASRRHNTKHITEAVEGSLKRLQTDYIDLYQLHWPDRPVVLFGRKPDPAQPETPPEEALRALDDMVKEGKIREIGVSNETPWGVMSFLHEAAAHDLPRVQSIQNAYSLLVRNFEFGLEEVCHREKVGLLAYSPLAQGYLTGKYRGGALPEGARKTLYDRMQRYESEGAQEAIDAYVKLAEEYGIDPAQLALKFVDSRPFTTSTILGATSLDQLKADIDAFDLDLTEELAKGISQIHRWRPNPAR